MWALVFDSPVTDSSQTRIADVPDLEAGPGEILIDVKYAGVNFKDVMARRGDTGYADTWPFTPGLEVAGVVRTVSTEATAFSPGDRVVALTNAGGLAQQAVASASLAVHVPNDVDLEIAATVPGALTTAHLLLHRQARIRSGDSLVVHSAAGAVGSALAALARLAGVGRLIGVVGAESRVKLALEAGYDEVHVREDGLGATIRRSLDGLGADVILDPQGTGLLNEDLEAVGVGGRIVLFGNAGGGSLEPLPHAGQLFRRNASIGGFSLEAYSLTAASAIRDTMSQVLADLEDGALHPSVQIVDGLSAVPDVHDSLAAGTGTGKYVVSVERANGVERRD